MCQTGDPCEKSGLYLGSGGCGHAVERRVKQEEPFPECKVCGKAVNWTLLRPLEAEWDGYC